MSRITQIKKPVSSILVARILIGVVIIFNMECALVFIFRPALYTAGFELSGTPGQTMVRGLGVLFLMWNVPYLFAFVSPIVHRVSLYQALLMQSIGLIGESIILATLPTEYQNIRYTAFRFILFDSIGLLTLLIAAWLTRLPRSLKKT